jgi:hypothetical protein
MLTAAKQQLIAVSSTHEQIGDAARAVAAGIRDRAVIIVDGEPRGAPSARRVMHDHELIEAEPRRAIDGPRLGRADDMARAAQVEHGNCIADAVHLHNRQIGEASHIRVPVPRTYRRKR